MVKLTKVLEDVVFTSNTDSKGFDDIEIVDIAYSSLKCQEGYMFVALKGETVDGHKYVFDAYSRGARVFVLQDDIEMADDAIKIIVEDSRIALSKISANYFGNPSKSLKIIGVTGTKGKTTITNYISEVLNRAGINTGVVGTNGCLLYTSCQRGPKVGVDQFMEFETITFAPIDLEGVNPE